MKTASQAIQVGRCASDAKRAYFDGDFTLCLSICDEIYVRTVATASELALLRARAYLRTGRPGEAHSTIVESLQTHLTLDAQLTAQMLLASAFIRQDEVDRGLGILADARARSAHGHSAIRSEIALCSALGYWAKRDLETSESYLAQVDPCSDIIHARALELQAWCHMARHDYRQSARSFQETLLRLEVCHAGDRVIAATAISTLAIYAAELFDRDLAIFVEQRSRQIDWSSGLTIQHFTTLLHQALFCEFAGDTVDAYQYAAEARKIAPTVAFEAFACATSSVIATNANEPISAITFAKRARRLLETIDTSELVGEERFSLLSVAESFARIDSGKSAELFTSYWGLASIDKLLPLAGDPRLLAEETLIEGMVAESHSNRELAQACYRKAFDLFKSLGYVRRAVISAHGLLKFGRDDEVCSYIEMHLTNVRNYISQDIPWRTQNLVTLLERHPLVASLSPVKKEVVQLVCLGKTNKQIAQLRRVGEQTIKNMLSSDLFPIFRVSSRAELVSKVLF